MKKEQKPCIQYEKNERGHFKNKTHTFWYVIMAHFYNAMHPQPVSLLSSKSIIVCGVTRITVVHQLL